MQDSWMTSYSLTEDLKMKKLILAMMGCLGMAGVATAQPFAHTDINAGLAGDAVVNPNGSITVMGGGADIWGADDGLHFAYVPVTGDGEIIAYLVSVTGGESADAWRKAGVMMRQSLASNSYNVCLIGAPGQPTVSWQRRPSTDGSNNSSSEHPFDDRGDQVWLRITREGNVFRSFYSLDPETTDPADVSWTAYGTPWEFAWPSTLYVGLCVTAHNNAQLVTGVFKNVYWNGVPFAEPRWGAVHWDPGPRAKDVPIGVYALSWEGLAPEGQTIRDYKVYFGESAEAVDPNNPNVENALLGTVTDTTIDSPPLSPDTTYYWRVASYIDDANVSKGVTVQFGTISYGVQITQQPQSEKYGPACEAALTVGVEPLVPGEGGDIHYQWYRVGEGDDVAVGTDSDTLLTDEDGAYYCIASNDVGSATSAVATVSASVHATPGNGDGKVLYEQFPTETGGVDSMLTAASSEADASELLTSTLWDGTDRNNYRMRLTLWLMPVTTGDYQFRVAGDDDTRLWLSFDADPANAVQIAGYTGYTGVNEWTKYETQTSGIVTLQRGGVYFLRAGVREGSGGDHIHVQWKGPGFDWQDISGGVMNSVKPDVWSVQNSAPAPVDENGWVDYNAENVTLSWDKAPYGPCDAVYTVYLSLNEAVIRDPNAEGAVSVQTSGLSVVVSNAGTLDLEHDQTWYYRIDVDSATAGEEELGLVYSFDTIKWVPLIATQPPASVVAAMPSDATISCVGSALNDDFAVLSNYTWYRIVGEKDAVPGAGDDEMIFTQDDPVETSRDEGKRYYDCSVVLSVTEIGHEGLYYCVVTNASGVAVSDDCLLLTQRKMVEYTFESLNGTTVPDSSPSGFDGTLVSVVEGGYPAHGGLVPGMVGNAIKLIGGEDPNEGYIDTGKTALELGIEGARPRSVSVWVKTLDMARSGVYSVGRYQSMEAFGLHNANDLTVSFTYQFDHWGSNWDYTGWVFDKWIHVVHVYDGANIRIYIDGEKLADYAAALNTAADGQPFAVGFWGSYSGVQHGVFNGRIDEFSLYNYALSPQEIAQLYVAGVGGTACVEAPQHDLTGDCQVDLEDFAIFAAAWAESSLVSP